MFLILLAVLSVQSQVVLGTWDGKTETKENYTNKKFSFSSYGKLIKTDPDKFTELHKDKKFCASGKIISASEDDKANSTLIELKHFNGDIYAFNFAGMGTPECENGSVVFACGKFQFFTDMNLFSKVPYLLTDRVMCMKNNTPMVYELKN